MKTYPDVKYKGSEAYNSVMHADLDQLQCRKPYTIGAIEFHKKEGNAGQVKFWTDELELIEKRIASLSKYEYEIIQYTAYGWEAVHCEDTFAGARRALKEYLKNMPSIPVCIRKVRAS
jgi:hypothetical protein